MLFDPYHQWLGIPPTEQPPNFYRLLGIRIYETNPDVIAAAAERIVQYVASFLRSEHAVLAQQLLQEVDGARQCLLHPASRDLYDQQLQAYLSHRSALYPPVASSPTHTPVPTHVPSALPLATIVPVAAVPQDNELPLAILPEASLPPTFSQPTNAPINASTSTPTNLSADASTRDIPLAIPIDTLPTAPVPFALPVAVELPTEHHNPSRAAQVIASQNTPAAAPLLAMPSIDVTKSSSTANDGAHNKSTAHPNAKATDDAQAQPQRQPKNPMIELAKIVAGSVAGLVAAVFILWYGFGNDVTGIFSGKPGKSARRVAKMEPDEIPIVIPEHLRETTPRSKPSAPAQSNSSPKPKPPKSNREKPNKSPQPSGESTSPTNSDTSAPTTNDTTNPSSAPSSPSNNPTTEPGKDMPSPMPNRSLESLLPTTTSPTNSPTTNNPTSPSPTMPMSTPSGTGTTTSPPATSASPTPNAPPAPVRKSPIPPSAEQQAALTQIEDIFKISKAATPADKLLLATQLAQAARDTQGNPAEQFMLLRKAADLSIEAGDPGAMLRRVEEMEGRFEIDGVRAKSALLSGFAAKAKDEKSIESVVNAAKRIVEQAVRDDKLDTALQLTETVFTMVQGPNGKKFRKYVADGRTHIKAKHAKWTEYVDATKKTQANPMDTAAQMLVGRWLCLERNQWELGIPHLAKSDHPQIKACVDRELAKPGDSAALIAVADAWREVANANEADADFGVRAYYWYQRAQSGAAGLQRVKVDKMLEEISSGLQKTGKLVNAQDLVAQYNAANELTKVTTPTTAGPATTTLNPNVDLLKSIVLSRDVVSGDWTMKDGYLITPQGADVNDRANRLMLPKQTSFRFELEMEVVRLSDRGNLVIWLPASNGQKVMVIDGIKDNVPYSAVSGSQMHRNPVLIKDQLVTIRCEMQDDRCTVNIRGGKRVTLLGTDIVVPNLTTEPGFAIQTGGSFRIRKLSLAPR